MRIKFIEEPKIPRDLRHLPYKKGLEFNMTEDEASRWLRQGTAEEVKPDAKPIKQEAKKENITVENLVQKSPEPEVKKPDSVVGGTSTMSNANLTSPTPSVSGSQSSPSLVKK